MKSIISALAILLFANASSNAQVMFTKNGSIKFNSTTTNTVDKVEATNKSAVCKLNSTTGDVEFAVLIKSFVFTNDLMQQHFNENYMESDKFPKANFKGKISNIKTINISKDGEYKADVEGTMTIHGKSKTTKFPGAIVVKGGKASIKSEFGLPLADYGISLPSAVKDKVSKEIHTVVTCALEALKK